jgi:uncharacterized protein (TIGR03083 family)
VPVDHIAAIRGESARLAALVAAGDQDAPVAACPNWTVRDLAAHVGEVQRFWAWSVQRRSTQWPAADEAPVDKPGADLVSWLSGGTDLLVSALQALDPAEPTWAWWPGACTVDQVARHQVHEVALHRWDAEETGGSEPRPFPADQAGDGIDELLHVTLSAESRPWEGTAGVLVIAPDDVERGWTIDCTGARPVVSDGAASTADCRLLGPASDLQLLLWNRPRQFRFRGDATILTDLLAWPSFD